MSPTSLARVAAMLRFFGSVSNLPLLTIDDDYYHSHDKRVKGKMETEQGYGMGIGGCNKFSHGHRGIAWLHYFRYPCQLRTIRCCGW